MQPAVVASLDDEVRRRTTDKLRRELGSQICEFLDNSNVIEIMLNPDGRLWVEYLSDGMKPFGNMSRSKAESVSETAYRIYSSDFILNNWDDSPYIIRILIN